MWGQKPLEPGGKAKASRRRNHGDSPPADVATALALIARRSEYYDTRDERRLINFSDLDLAWVDLSGGVFYRANFAGANLNMANLENCDFREANLHGTNLLSAQMTQCDLTSANVREADLLMAVLERARLVKADLTGSDLSGANLRGADLAEARLGGAEVIEQGWNVRSIDETLLIKSDLVGANFLPHDLTRANPSSVISLNNLPKRSGTAPPGHGPTPSPKPSNGCNNYHDQQSDQPARHTTPAAGASRKPRLALPPAHPGKTTIGITKRGHSRHHPRLPKDGG